jgi:hypothetical protein
MAYIPESFDIHLPLAFVNVHDQDSGDHGKVIVEEEKRCPPEEKRFIFHSV